MVSKWFSCSDPLKVNLRDLTVLYENKKLVSNPPLTALLTAIRKLASPPKRLAMVLETGTYAMGITSIGTPFFHCWPRALESFLRGEGRVRIVSGHPHPDSTTEPL